MGQALVSELRFTQDFLPAALPPETVPQADSARAIAAVEKKLLPVPEGPLRDALAALGRSVHAARAVPARIKRTPSTLPRRSE